jgi:hypothetical protein
MLSTLAQSTTGPVIKAPNDLGQVLNILNVQAQPLN